MILWGLKNVLPAQNKTIQTLKMFPIQFKFLPNTKTSSQYPVYSINLFYKFLPRFLPILFSVFSINSIPVGQFLYIPFTVYYTQFIKSFCHRFFPSFFHKFAPIPFPVSSVNSFPAPFLVILKFFPKSFLAPFPFHS